MLSNRQGCGHILSVDLTKQPVSVNQSAELMAQKICELPLTPIQEKVLNLQPEMISVLPDIKIWSEMLTTTLFSGHWASRTFHLQIYQGK